MLFRLFITFFKIGAFTFGGGYAMISIVKEECVDKYKWLGEEEFLNMLAVAESTPGPIAINMATYVGYKVGKMTGAIVSTLAVIIPSTIVIYIIALFLGNIFEIKMISDAFMGIRVAVALVIIRTGFSLIKSEYKTSEEKTLTLVLFLIYMFVAFLITILNINISVVALMVIAIIIGTIHTLIKNK